MQRAKLFAAAITLALSGAVYTAANMQETASHAQAAKKTTAAASCCAGHKAEGGHAAMSCDKDGKGCCAKHKEGGAHHASMNEGESCCAGGACCGGGDSCCAGGSCEKHKKGEATVVKASVEQGGESCCKDGAACCKDGASCCAGHKAVAQKASVEHKDGEGCCACCAGHKEGGR